MRVVHAVVSDAFAGVEQHVARLAQAQHESGHLVHVAGGAPTRMFDALRTDEGGPTFSPASTVRQLIDVLRRHRPLADVVHVHMTAAEIAASVALAGTPRSRGPVVVSTRHFARSRGHGPSVLVVRPVARHRIAAQIAISHYVAAHVEGGAAVVPPGIEARPDAPSSTGRARTVLLAQRLQPEKRSDLAVGAFAASGLSDSGWRLDVAGDGAQRSALEQQTSRLGLDRHVRFLGARRDVDELMRTAGILLAPCPVEGLGLSVLEAMASGLPVVANPAGGHRELLDGIDEVCLPRSGDVAGIASSLTALARDGRRRDMAADAAVARQRELFTPARQVDLTTRVYEHALSRRPAHRVGT